MGTKNKKEDSAGNAILTKIAEEKIRAFDQKHVKSLIEILVLLKGARIKGISGLSELIQRIRPEMLDSFMSGKDGAEAK